MTPKEIGEKLSKNFLKQPKTSKTTNALQQAFIKEAARLPAKPHFIRMGTFDLQSCKDGAPKLVMPSMDHARSDLQMVTNRPVIIGNQGLTDATNKYLVQFLQNELSNQMNFALKAVENESDYTAIIDLDYYASRAVTRAVAHKDTLGYSLFVSLHYENANTMEGPEYLIDKWPCPVSYDTDGGTVDAKDYLKHGELFNQRKLGGKFNVRMHAPWRKRKQSQAGYWPKTLLEGLELARKDLKNSNSKDEWGKSKINSNGMIVFVDELIYHTTPKTDHRDFEDAFEKAVFISTQGKDDFLNITQHRVDLKPAVPTLTRKMSTDVTFNYEKEHDKKHKYSRKKKIHDVTSPSSSGEVKGVRRFARAWISIVPKNWLQESRKRSSRIYSKT